MFVLCKENNLLNCHNNHDHQEKDIVIKINWNVHIIIIISNTTDKKPKEVKQKSSASLIRHDDDHHHHDKSNI